MPKPTIEPAHEQVERGNEDDKGAVHAQLAARLPDRGAVVLQVLEDVDEQRAVVTVFWQRHAEVVADDVLQRLPRRGSGERLARRLGANGVDLDAGEPLDTRNGRDAGRERPDAGADLEDAAAQMRRDELGEDPMDEFSASLMTSRSAAPNDDSAEPSLMGQDAG